MRQPEDKNPFDPADTDWGRDMERRMREAEKARAEHRRHPSTPYRGPDTRRVERWHVGKEIPLVFVAAVLLQTVAAVWWIAQLSSKIDGVIVTVTEMRNERYTREDARRDRELIDQKMQSLTQVDRELERRVLGVEGRLDRIERK